MAETRARLIVGASTDAAQWIATSNNPQATTRKRLTVKQQMVHPYIGDAPPVHGARAKKVGHHVAYEDRLAHPARTQQHHGPAQFGIDKQLAYGIQIGAWPQGTGHFVYPGVLPPRIPALEMVRNLLIWKTR